MEPQIEKEVRPPEDVRSIEEEMEPRIEKVVVPPEDVRSRLKTITSRLQKLQHKDTWDMRNGES